MCELNICINFFSEAREILVYRGMKSLEMAVIFLPYFNCTGRSTVTVQLACLSILFLDPFLGA